MRPQRSGEGKHRVKGDRVADKPGGERPARNVCQLRTAGSGACDVDSGEHDDAAIGEHEFGPFVDGGGLRRRAAARDAAGILRHRGLCQESEHEDGDDAGQGMRSEPFRHTTRPPES